ncbi:DUF4269 domain-containing protein [Solitalea canadensis]|uniref:DUF4269 domain-containing protein n=1 Tax=Solitalea canadensis (strain ATCC 29591 / DSM 3403 / JCM 21819 / LMG 8368 / NBRC 15130 / NCIMB 12057 / USAM 9D) TaxID=929556 RepID=H8KM85_SOLCM|nr:DUF4269 domain-containing protein [Solitalea canadensis]AFD09267.1 hypothetical protein Solca_4277 [Solitalea canadensis DSM 3403]
MPDWRSLEYLLNGTKRQKDAYYALNEIALMEKLKDYHPILVGTIPIDIDIPKSDLDIICQAHDYADFGKLVQFHFGNFDNFTTNQNENRFLANFKYGAFDIEIFATNQPTEAQPAYRHMLIEDRILQLLGNKFRSEIRNLKSKGLKTEPAFGALLEFGSNPYEVLLVYERWSPTELKEKLSSFITKYQS